MKDLITRLEAAESGSDALDREIVTTVGIEWSADEEGRWGGYNILPRRCHFTRSLDAALPGENITKVSKYAHDKKFLAVHINEAGEWSISVAHTEALARRIACLKAREGKEA